MTKLENHRVPWISILATVLTGAIVWLTFCVLPGDGRALTEFPMDDAWIHQVYVRGLIHDGLPTYNPGEPEAGFSSALWLLVQVPSFWIAETTGESFAVAAKLVSFLLALVAAWGIGLLARELSGANLGRSFAIVLALLTPGFAFAAVSGMEVTLAAATVAFALLAFHRRRFGTCGLLLGLAGLARPELGLMVVILVVAALVAPRGGDRRLGVAIKLIWPSVLMGGLWLVYNLSVTGHPLPNTFYVKTGGATVGAQVSGFFRVVVLSSGWIWTFVTAALFAVGCWWVLRKAETRLLGAAILAVQVFGLLGMVLTHGDPELALFSYQRYFLPLTILDSVFVALGLVALTRWISRLLKRPRPAVLVGGLPLFLLVPPLVDATESYEGHCVDTDVLHTQPAVDVRDYTPDDVVIAVEGAGAARFFSERYTVDLLGLNYYPLAHVDDATERTCLMVGNEPDLLLVPIGWLQTLGAAFEIEVIELYERDRWIAVGGSIGRTVAAARARVKPGTWSLCVERYGT